MKHIGLCLDRIQILMSQIPREVDSESEKKQARFVLNEVEMYLETLVEIITNPKFRKYLNELEHSSDKGVQLSAGKIEELFKDLNHMLQVLNLYIRELKEIILKRPEQWGRAADQITLMIDQKFGGENGELREEFQVALHAEDELRELVTSKNHLKEFFD
jgi:phosphoribosylanthranilate isomerase